MKWANRISSRKNTRWPTTPFAGCTKTNSPAPCGPFALFRMGCVDFQNGNFEQAGLNWGQLVKEFPQTLSGPASQYLLAEISLRQGELAKAIPGFSALITNDDYTMGRPV
jgi:TolA-binding protein